jgi:predicted lipoprotein with Yx(FWY)xxD motif
MNALRSTTKPRTHVMMSHDTRRRRPRPSRLRALAATVALLACAALLAACGSSSGGSSNNGGGSGGSGTSTGGSASGGSATVAVGKVAGYGSVLVTASNQPVYILSTDPSGSSKCVGSCAKTWKPVTVSGKATAGSGADSSMVSSFKRKDGTTQVLYNKHALYTHAGSPASVAGTASDGGVWYLINAKGAPVKSTTSGGY